MNAKQIITDYAQEYLPIKDIAENHKLSRQTIYKVLRDNNIKVSAKILIECSYCQEPRIKYRSQIRGRQDHFCNMDCRDGFMKVFYEESNLFTHRASFNVIGQVFPGLGEDHSIHYMDGDYRNNLHRNLRVFKTFRDHLDYHQKLKVKPVWSGVGK